MTSISRVYAPGSVRAGQPVIWRWTGVMLIARTALFAMTQAVIAFIFWLQGVQDPWQASQGWWTVVALIGSMIGLMLLVWRLRCEGDSYRALFIIDRSHILRDVLVTLALIVASIPLILVTSTAAINALFSDPAIPQAIMFRPLPLWAWLLQLLFPVFVALSELPTYFGYARPRVETLTGRAWLAVGLSAFWLAAQHMALPLVFDWHFMLYRLLMFLPFALLVGVSLRLRPRLLPYFAVVHGLMDMSMALMMPVQ
jgi:hypothetical protein